MRVHGISRLPINRPWSLPVHLRMPTASMLRATQQRLHAGLATKAIFLCLTLNRKISLICLKFKSVIPNVKSHSNLFEAETHFS